jgi:hypothetical protein
MTTHFQNIIGAASAASATSISASASAMSNSNYYYVSTISKKINSSASVTIVDNQTKTNTTYFIFPSQKALFGPTVNAIKQGDAAILNGKWTIQQPRAIANGLPLLVKKRKQQTVTTYEIYNRLLCSNIRWKRQDPIEII